MHRKWKSVAALGMAVLLGCLMPMGTMLAAEEDTEAVQEMEADSASEADEVRDDEAVSSDDAENADGENVGAEGNAEDESIVDAEEADDGNTGEEAGAVDEEADIEDENADGEADADNDGNVGIAVMSVTEEPEAGDIEVQENTAAPEITITWAGQSYKYDMGGKIDYKYVKNTDQMLECSASQDEAAVSFSYYLDRVTDTDAEAKRAEDITWPDGQTSPLVRILSEDANYVLYVKAVGKDGQTVYARSGGIVVDTVVPEIVGLEEGKTYPEGTSFKVSDANLDVVMVNESPATPKSDGSYQVVANGTSCLIRAKDKAGNEKTCSIIVFGKLPTEDPVEDPTEDPTEDPAEDPAEDTVISASGTYALKTGTSYQLAAGTWQVGGDSTTYQGGRTFYVKTAGDYSFTKR